MSERTTRDKKSGLSLGDKGDPIGTDEFRKIGQMAVFTNIDKSSIHAGLRDFDKNAENMGAKRLYNTL